MKVHSIARAATHFARSYATVAIKVAFRLGAGPLLRPRHTQEFVHSVLESIDVRDDDPVLRTSNATDLIRSDVKDIVIRGTYHRLDAGGTRLLAELSSLAYLVKAANANEIFEIGTFVGRTTRLFVDNASPNARIHTLDLPRDQLLHDVGRDFRNTPEEARITQLVGDSRTFDFSPWFGKCDFVWVDACHDYEYVKSDTENALNLVRPGGWIGWHDYRHTAWWSGVTRCVRETAARYPNVVFLRGTTTAVLQVPARASVSGTSV